MDLSYDDSYRLDPLHGTVLIPEQFVYQELHEDESVTNTEIRARISASTEKYIRAVDSIVNFKLDSRIKAYLRIAALSWPFRFIVVGQSPYKSQILPALASAFAFDTEACPGYTPSVQVLAQFMSLTGEIEAKLAAGMLATSYTLVVDGVLFINAIPYVTDNTVLSMKLSSATSQYLRDILLPGGEIGLERVTVLKVGIQAAECVSNAIDSIPTQVRKQLNLVTSEFEHPASVSRRASAETPSEYSRPMARFTAVNSYVNRQLRRTVVMQDPGRYRHHDWHSYSFTDIVRMGLSSKLKGLTKHLSRVGSESSLKDFSRILAEFRSKSKLYAMSEKQYKTLRQGEGETRPAYADRLLSSASATCREATEFWSEAKPQLEAMLEKHRQNPRSVELEDLITVMNKNADAYSGLVASLRAVHANLTRAQSAIAMGQGKSAPLSILGIKADLDHNPGEAGYEVQTEAEAEAETEVRVSASIAAKRAERQRQAGMQKQGETTKRLASLTVSTSPVPKPQVQTPATPESTKSSTSSTGSRSSRSVGSRTPSGKMTIAERALARRASVSSKTPTHPEPLPPTKTESARPTTAFRSDSGEAKPRAPPQPKAPPAAKTPAATPITGAGTIGASELAEIDGSSHDRSQEPSLKLETKGRLIPQEQRQKLFENLRARRQMLLAQRGRGRGRGRGRN